MRLALPALFSATLLYSAALLFLVQPLVGKALLPHLGGAAHVWTTCMLFFQLVLLAGYAYSWALTRVQRRVHALGIHIVVLVLASLTLPLEYDEGATRGLVDGVEPVSWLLGVLVGMVGLPFFALSAHTPLLSDWFAGTRHERAADPYYLYAASNLGSMASLVLFPFVFEPLAGVGDLMSVWSVGFVGCAVLIVACGSFTRGIHAPLQAPDDAPPGAEVQLRWVILALVPSSHMLSLTTYLTTDLASVPLLWIAPLALYLGTFILAYSRYSTVAMRVAARAAPFLILALGFLLAVRATEPLGLILSLHLAAFVACAMLCHGRLAALRPSSLRLGRYYFLVSLGGALGSVGNALLAPALFDRVLEYPLAVAAAAAFLPSRAPDQRPRPLAALVPVGLTVFALVLSFAAPHFGLPPAGARFLLGMPLILAIVVVGRPALFALALAGILLVSAFAHSDGTEVLFRERSFFGVSRVVRKPGEWTQLYHGNTVHGRQYAAPDLRGLAGTYYHPDGPVGDVMKYFRQLNADGGVPPRVGVVGLGAGTLATYARSGERWAFYEIDPLVARIAQEPSWFTFVTDARARGATIDVRTGDGRLLLHGEPEGELGLILVDAFNSGSIPLHLLTREALALYRSRITSGGLIMLHVSNRYLDLGPVLGRLAEDAGLHAFVRDDLAEDDHLGWREPSRWIVLMAADAIPAPDWSPLAPGGPLFTDDFVHLTSAIRP